jgi:hypothetical protein
VAQQIRRASPSGARDCRRRPREDPGRRRHSAAEALPGVNRVQPQRTSGERTTSPSAVVPRQLGKGAPKFPSGPRGT